MGIDNYFVIFTTFGATDIKDGLTELATIIANQM